MPQISGPTGCLRTRPALTEAAKGVATMAKNRNTALEPHRQAWLAAHPERDESWLRRMAAEGFDIHHVDGNHDNDDPDNLVLIEHRDHFMLHRGKRPRPLHLTKRFPVGPPCWWDESPVRHVRLDRPCFLIWHAPKPDRELRPTKRKVREWNAYEEYHQSQRALVKSVLQENSCPEPHPTS